MKKSLGPKTLLYPTPVLVVGVYDDRGAANVMTAAWGGICCSKPPAVAVSLRAATYTHGWIKANKAFTISIPSRGQAGIADYFGIVSGRDQDKFAAAGVTAVKSDLVNAPYVAEFPVVLELSLLHVLEIGLHTLFVGEILDVKIEESCLDATGAPDPARIDPISFSPDTRAYYALGECVGPAFSMGKAIKKPG